ncbi:MAG TPA: lipoprotein [Methyloversatilis sp.]
MSAPLRSMARSIAASVASANLLNSLSFIFRPPDMFSCTLVRIAALTLMLAGCGTKGPLVLPPKDGVTPAATTATTTPPASKNHNKAPSQ